MAATLRSTTNVGRRRLPSRAKRISTNWNGTEDIRFVRDELNRVASRLPFSARLDFTRGGGFGHSFGGIAAAHACQTDQRIKACLNQDGAVASQPYFLDVRRW